MNKTKFLSLIVLLLVVINAGMLVYLFLMQHPQHPPHPNREKGPSGFIIKKLQLDEQQQKQFIALRDEHRNAMDALRDSMENTREKYFDGLKTDSIDTASTRNYQNQIGQLQAHMHGITFEHFAQVRKICSPKQKKLFDKFIDEILGGLAPPPQGGRAGRQHPPHKRF